MVPCGQRCITANELINAEADNGYRRIITLFFLLSILKTETSISDKGLYGQGYLQSSVHASFWAPLRGLLFARVHMGQIPMILKLFT